MKFNNEIILFFKKHNLYDEEMFDYLARNTTIIDYNDLEQRIFIGCFYMLDEQNTLTKIHLNIPYINDEKTTLISIHELVHGIELYQNLNKKITITDDSEILPMLYEKIYVEEKQDEKLKECHKQINAEINREDKKYLIALMLREELYNEYDGDIEKIKRKAKQLYDNYNTNI